MSLGPFSNKMLHNPQKNALAICIPVHGASEALARTLSQINQEEDPKIQEAEIVLTNSGSPLSKDLLLARNITVLPIPNDYYWTKAVITLYQYCHRTQKQQILLMNHDCIPTTGSLSRLLDFREKHPKAVCHPVLTYLDRPDIVCWAGRHIRFGRRDSYPFLNSPLAELPQTPYQVDSLSGQCLLMPIEAAREEFLYGRYLPHYFSDIVQTSCMRRAGFPLYMIPDAVALTDQSDLERKRKRTRCDSWHGFHKALFAPYSLRNLKGVAVASFLQQDTVLGGILLALYITTGKLGKSLLEWLNWQKRL